MRRAYGETGTFVGRQMARGLGGDVIALTVPPQRTDPREKPRCGRPHETHRFSGGAALPGRPVLHLPHHLSLPLEPSRSDARRALGLCTRRHRGDGARAGDAGQAPRLGSSRAREPVAGVPEPAVRRGGGRGPRPPLASWVAASGIADPYVGHGPAVPRGFRSPHRCRRRGLEPALPDVRRDVGGPGEGPRHGSRDGGDGGDPRRRRVPGRRGRWGGPGPPRSRRTRSRPSLPRVESDGQDDAGPAASQFVRREHDLAPPQRDSPAFS